MKDTIFETEDYLLVLRYTRDIIDNKTTITAVNKRASGYLLINKHFDLVEEEFKLLPRALYTIKANQDLLNKFRKEHKDDTIGRT